MEPSDLTPVSRKWLAAAATAAVYYVLARVGIELALDGTASCAVWPAAGFALVAAIAIGPEACLGVFFGAWLANLRSLPALEAGPSAAAALACAGVALGAALQALAGARFLKDDLGGPAPLASLRQVARLAALAPLVCLIGATAGTGALFSAGLLGPEALGRTWLTWWTADLVAVLLAAPLFFAWRPGDADAFGEPLSPRRALEAASALALLALSVGLGFGDLVPPAARYPLGFLPFTALIWITVRHDLRGATAGAAVTAALVHWHTARGLGPFAREGALNESLLLASPYVAAAALTALFLRAQLAEHEQARDALKRRMSERECELSDANACLRVAALGRSEDDRRIQLYRRIVSEIPVGIAVLRIENPRDPGGWLIVDFNAAGLRLTAPGAANPSGGRLLDFAPELRGGELPRACVEALRLGREVDIGDFAGMKRAPGRRFSIRVFPLGAPLVCLAFDDITARKSAEEALARSNDELTQFAYVASHDLQAPLRKVTAFAEQLKLRLGPGLDETSLDFVRRMERSIEGMQALIDALLSLAQVTARAASPRDVDLAAVAREVLADLDDAIRRSGARVRVGPLPVVRGDYPQMRQLLQNLIGNALKFTAPGRAPAIRLRGRMLDGDRCELVVEDDGIGFDMKFADRIFQPFQRLQGRHEYPGSGLGLAICRRIVERRGGTIAVESAPGRGARFTIVFPGARPLMEAIWNNASESCS